MAVLGDRRCPIGLAAPLRFEILDSQPVKSDMGPVPIEFYDFRLSQKSCDGFLPRYLSCFQPNRPKVGFSSVSAGTKKMCDAK